jgi:hypothetical protein
MPKPVAVYASTDTSTRISMDLRGRQFFLRRHLTVMHKTANQHLIAVNPVLHFPCPGSNHNSVYVIDLTGP